MLETDERSDADDMSKTYSDVAVPQFWDGQKLLGYEVSRSFGMTERAAWDVYLFYPPGAEWTDAGLPPATKVLAQSEGGVVALEGTLPPKGDQTAVPAWGAGRLDVVGQPAELAALLSEVAVAFTSTRAE